MNHAEAAAMVDAARENDVFLMEAFMYRCHPQIAKVVELIQNGVQLVRSLSSVQYSATDRILTRKAGFSIAKWAVVVSLTSGVTRLP